MQMDSSYSPELTALTDRWVEATLKNSGKNVTGLLTQLDPLIFCGPSVQEIWEGEDLRRSYENPSKNMSSSRILETRTKAFCNGDTGWSLWEGDIQKSKSGDVQRARITLVFVIEGGIWRIQHIHSSIPDNDEGIDEDGLRELTALFQARSKHNPVVGETGIAAIMFTDVVDSSALTVEVGDVKWTAAISRHLLETDGIVRRNGGQLVKSLGDGSMASFQTAESALRAAQAIQARVSSLNVGPSMSLRIGIRTGVVVETGNDFFGTVVNKAARIAASAAPNEIRVSDATRLLVNGMTSFRFSDPTERELKGIRGLHQTFRLDRVDPPDPE
ncbi:Adenylate and Guanylate cyclase catalytic domain protein [Shimia sp. SK013]|nr:Adenylate and Guanylate cyclase catalytic domain protein [Shimia sp. SK013]